MTKKSKRLNLAVAVLKALHLILKIAVVAYDLYSKVVNYAYLRELQTFLLKERQADIRP